jgi:outer membrane protein OmpA-like peptidoglycan-associated protein
MGVASAIVLNGALTITPTATFSGKLSLPVTVTTLGVPVDLIVQLTVNPAAVTNLIQSPTSATSSTVTWTSSSNAIGYQIFVDGTLICLTLRTQCNVAQLTGPKSKIEVVALGNDGTVSAGTVAVYAPAKPVEIGAINFTTNKSALDAASKKRLLALVAVMKAHRFTSMTIVGHFDSKKPSRAAKALATARAKATLSFLAKYLKVTMKVVVLGSSGTVPAGTVAVNAYSKPVEISAVNFAPNKSALDAAAKASLLAFVEVMKSQGFTSVTIVGHLDSKKPSRADKAVATARAKATLSFLAKYMKVTMKVVAQSSSDVISNTKTKAGQALNRRISLLVK